MKKTVFRNLYIEKIRPFYDDTELVKLLFGMRRAGKSVLMAQIADEILERSDADHIIAINFESLEYADILTATKLNEYVIDRLLDDSTYYLFLDEIQLVDNFEWVINSLRATKNISIFATGSNGKLLSGELATMLSGRYVKFEVFPLNFLEACEYLEINEDEYSAFFKNYCRYGGLPHRFTMSDNDQIEAYLSDVYDSIAKRDIVDRSRITNTSLFQSVFQYTLESLGNLFSVKKIVGYLTSIGRKTSRETIYSYLDAITAALLVSQVARYDVAGKTIMERLVKYYATDLGILQLKAARSKINEGAILENIVYNELKLYGYDVYVGHLNSSEIDFVAIKKGIISYYQVTNYLSNEEVINREFGAFDLVHDNNAKYVISQDKEDFSRDGIIHKNIIDWIIDINKHERKKTGGEVKF
jgi:predicted AAA+ superfamily ATPase